MSEMNLPEILQTIQELRSNLENLGVTPQGLWIVAGLATLLFIFSLREVVGWFLRIQPLRRELKRLHAEVQQLQQMSEALRTEHQAIRAELEARSNKELETEAEKEDENEEAKSSKASDPNRFRFDH